jgi:hypothetical protein
MLANAGFDVLINERRIYKLGSPGIQILIGRFYQRLPYICLDLSGHRK